MSNISALSRQIPVPGVKTNKTDIFIAGIGAVGGTLIRQINNLSDANSFNIIGVCNSTEHFGYQMKNPKIQTGAFQTEKPKTGKKL